jgi:glycosyltransferase involved in cell wall biosynthesis
MAHGESQYAPGAATRRRRIACLSEAPWNPYLRLLYGHLATHGFEVVCDPRFSLRWLWRARSSVTFLHFHWPEGLYRYERGPPPLRPVLSRAKLALFAVRLAAARILGYRLVWTIHQVFPHESVDRVLERRAARLLWRACDLVVAHDRWTAAHARSELGKRPEPVVIVPHGSYIGVYPEGRPRSEVRGELGLRQDSFVFLCFGELRAYKEIDLVLAAFAPVSLPNVRLVVAGNAKTPTVGSAVRAASANDSRVLVLLGFLPEERVAELFHACDAAVIARGDGGTSGSLVLALSMGLPVIAADVETTRELTREGEAGWLFRPHDVVSLRAVLNRAGADRSEARTRGLRAYELAEELEWAGIARDLAHLLDRVDG